MCNSWYIVSLLLFKKKYFHVISHTCRFGKKLKYLISFKYFLRNETSYTTAYIYKDQWYTNSWFNSNWIKHELKTHNPPPTFKHFTLTVDMMYCIYSNLPREQRVLLEVTQVQRDGATGGGVPRPLQDHRLGVHLAQTVTTNPSHQCNLFLRKYGHPVQYSKEFLMFSEIFASCHCIFFNYNLSFATSKGSLKNVYNTCILHNLYFISTKFSKRPPQYKLITIWYL